MDYDGRDGIAKGVRRWSTSGAGRRKSCKENVRKFETAESEKESQRLKLEYD